MNDYPSLLRNDGGNKNNWINIKLLGTQCNRTAIGARVRVVTGKHAQIDEVHTGTSVMSQSDLRLHFGLGAVAASGRDRGQVAHHAEGGEDSPNVAANQFLTIKEGAGIIKREPPNGAANTTKDGGGIVKAKASKTDQPSLAAKP